MGLYRFCTVLCRALQRFIRLCGVVSCVAGFGVALIIGFHNVL